MLWNVVCSFYTSSSFILLFSYPDLFLNHFRMIQSFCEVVFFVVPSVLLMNLESTVESMMKVKAVSVAFQMFGLTAARSPYHTTKKYFKIF